ncbi:hypothetical protein ABIE67_006931 [Streptomyces sp. V4I8]
MRGRGGPWWGRLDEIDFLESLYDLDGPASTDSRFTTARGDMVQHRVNNPLDLPDDRVFGDPRFQLSMAQMTCFSPSWRGSFIQRYSPMSTSHPDVSRS